MTLGKVETETIGRRQLHVLERPDFQEALRTIFEEKIPFCRALNLKFRIVRGRAEVSFAKHDFMLGNTRLKVLHGGVTAAVLDSVAGTAILLKMVEMDPKPDLVTQLREFARVSTIDLRVDYLEPASAENFLVV
jgi:acyl-coenzyme A thioesterase PaaI-like protein